MSTELYDFFGIEKNANEEEIKKAYRQKAMDTHPDKNYGRRDEFEKANKYYNILINNKLRLRYDNTGKIPDDSQKKSEFISILVSLFEQMLTSGIKDIRYDDIFDMMRISIKATIKEIKKADEQLKKSNINIEAIKKRIICKSKGQNIFVNILEDKIELNEASIEDNEKMLNNLNEALTFLSQYDYQKDKREEMVQILMSGATMYYDSATDATSTSTT